MLNLTNAGPAIGAGLALAGLILGKESKTSDFRQAWIDGLREDVAKLTASAFMVSGPAKDEKQMEQVRVLNETAMRIRLRFAVDDEQSIELLSCQARLVDTAYKSKDFWEVHDVAEEFTLATQKILKSEWIRVKRGEWRYRLVLSGALATLVALIITMFWPR